MEPLAIFILHLTIPALLGLGISLYLKGVTLRLLTDMCGTQDRSEFWVKITTILVIATPTVLVLMFGDATTIGASTGELLRRTLALSLLGIVCAIGILARTIWKSIPQTPTPSSKLPAPNLPA